MGKNPAMSVRSDSRSTSNTARSNNQSDRSVSSVVDDPVMMAYVDQSDRIIKKTIKRYVQFVADDKRTVDTERWNRFMVVGGLRLYQERTADASVRDTMVSSSGSEGTFLMASPSREMKVVSAFGGGHLQGTLETIMEGLYADTTQQMKQQSSIQYPGLIDCSVMEAVETESPDMPFHFFGVKWLQKRSHLNDTTDELCWVERMGVMVDASGRPFGYQLVKSVDLGAPMADRVDKESSRVTMSICYIYNQLNEEVTEVYIRGIVEPPMDSDKAEIAANAAGEYILAPVKAKACAQMKKISELIQKSKDEREQRLACRCSKVVKGLPKRDICSTCKETMRIAKLVPIGDLQSGRLTLSARLDRNSFAMSRRNTLLASSMLESRAGFVREDGQVPDDVKSYNEATSLRMFMPILDPRPNTEYRAKRKDNVLTMMLRHHQRKRDSAAADRAPITE
ncbi:TPA: hypothetical protein N0F65_007402 [Lagenidium giganteum]|uniref:START domain-containing protein n=1 Tax=Lagenidium giganteum TaxID=4803 RepID=A0AAV2ZRN9_9STRA|nr:TPA: hypothetical protein N0F65_007402 [Lagenidium giganteum]